MGESVSAEESVASAPNETRCWLDFTALYRRLKYGEPISVAKSTSEETIICCQSCREALVVT